MFKHLALPFSSAPPHWPAPRAASLELTNTGLSKAEGHVLVAVFGQPTVWLKVKPLRSLGAKVEGGVLQLRLDDPTSVGPTKPRLRNSLLAGRCGQPASYDRFNLKRATARDPLWVFIPAICTPQT